MIIKDRLLEIWDTLTPSNEYPYTYKKIDEDTPIDLNIGLSNKSKKCLILILPKDFKEVDATNRIYKSSFKMENIELIVHDNREVILLLKQEMYLPEFIDFIETLLPKIIIANEYESPNVFIQTVRDWLSQLQILGLMAELYILNRELNISPNNINSTLKGWKGPYGFSKDFEFGNKFIEVKYTTINNNSVRIHSEYQLEADSKKPIELIVVFGEEDEINGKSLSSLNFSLREKIRKLKGDINIYLKALDQLGIKQNDMKKYDFIKISFTEIVVYDASSPYFPSIKKSNLDNAISKVEYNLALNSLEKYISLRELL
jgi:hypothetical protein